MSVNRKTKMVFGIMEFIIVEELIKNKSDLRKFQGKVELVLEKNEIYPDTLANVKIDNFIDSNGKSHMHAYITWYPMKIVELTNSEIFKSLRKRGRIQNSDNLKEIQSVLASNGVNLTLSGVRKLVNSEKLLLKGRSV